MQSAPSLDRELRRSQAAGQRLIVDLEHVEFMDCAGLRVLVGAAARANRGAFIVRSAPPQVQRLLELTGHTSVLGLSAEIRCHTT